MTRRYFWGTLLKELVGPTNSKLLFFELLAVMLTAHPIVLVAGIVCLLIANGRLVIIVAGILLVGLAVASVSTIISRPFAKLSKTRGKIRSGAEKQITTFILGPAAKAFVVGLANFEKKNEGYPKAQALEVMATIGLYVASGMDPLSAFTLVQNTVSHAVTVSQNPAFPQLAFENERSAYPTYFTLRLVAGLKMRTFCADITRGEVWEVQ